MANVVIILGSSGSGKSSSVKTLNEKETFIVNTLGKRLPFKGSSAMYSKENKNLFKPNAAGYAQVIGLLDKINTQQLSIKNVILDDCIYLMRTEFFDNISRTGFDKYNAMADHFRKLIEKCTSMRDDLNIFLLLHEEPVESDGRIVSYKVSTVGKLLDKMYNPLEHVSVTLFAKPKYDDSSKPTYGFYTHRIQVEGIEVPAKTPEGMFEEDFIPNDLNLVVDKMNKYYNE